MTTIGNLEVTNEFLYQPPTGVDFEVHADINMNDFKIFNLAGPPTQPQEAANKEYVDEAIPIGAIIMWSGSVVPPRWALCNGGGVTPNLIDRFIMGSTTANIGDTGGSPNSTLPAHTHTANHDHTGSSAGAGAHAADLSHGHTGTIEESGNHVHTDQGGPTIIHTEGTPTNAIQAMGSASSHDTNSGGIHTHILTIDATALGFNFPNHTHGITINTKNVTTSSTGTTITGKNNPAYYKLAYIMRIS